MCKQLLHPQSVIYIATTLTMRLNATAVATKSDFNSSINSSDNDNPDTINQVLSRGMERRDPDIMAFFDTYAPHIARELGLLRPDTQQRKDLVCCYTA